MKTERLVPRRWAGSLKAVVASAGMGLVFWGSTMAAQLHGRVVNGQGSPIAGLTVTVTAMGQEERREIVTGSDGSYALADLDPGVYSVAVRPAALQEPVRKEVTLAGATDSVTLDFQIVAPAPARTVAAGPERNPNIFIYRIDFNDVRNRLQVARGPDTQYIPVFTADQNYFGAEFGTPLFRFEPVRPGAPVEAWHGYISGTHQNSALNARNFFNVGPLLASRSSAYEVTGGGPLIAERAFLQLQFGQNLSSGMVNGNVQVPLVSERVPRSADPRVNAVIAALLAAYPLQAPNLPQVSLRQLNSNAPRSTNSIDALAKLDYKLGTRSSLAVRYSINDYNEDPFQLVTGQNPETNLRNQSTDITLMHTFSAQTLGLVGFHFDRSKALLELPRRYAQLLAPLGITTVPDIQFATNNTSSSELGNIGPGPKFPRRRFQNRFQPYADFSRTAGRHALRVGWNSVRAQVNDLQSDNTRGSIRFFSDFGRSAVENFLLGAPSSFTVAFGDPYRGFRNWEHTLWVQDQIRVLPTLNLTVGLRYELMTAPTEVNGLTDIQFPTDKNNFAPRLGLAWNPGRGNTTIRASYGISYGTIFPGTYQVTRFNPPAIQVVTINAPDFLSSLNRGVQQPTPGGRSELNLLSPDLVFPYSQQYTLAIEHQLPWASLLRTAYIGSRSVHLLSQGVYNRARPVPGLPATTANINQRRPDPTHFAVNVIESNSIAYYDALQVSLDKRLTRGLSFRTTYTFGKNIDTGGDFTNTASGVDAPAEYGMPASELVDRIADMKGVSLFDTPHALAISYSYDVPYRSGAGGLESALLSGWQISGVNNFQSGIAFHLHPGSDAPGVGNVDGAAQDRPSIVNPSILGASIDHPDTAPLILRPEYFDTNIPVGGRGNLGQNTFRKAGTKNWNLALNRNFHFPGGRENSVQFRTEIFNLFNHAQFDKPGVNISEVTFGKITNTVNKGRQVQFSLRVSF